MANTARTSLTFDSTIGRLRVSALTEHLVEVKLRAPELPDSFGDDDATAMARRGQAEIEAYLSGELTDFEVPWRILGSGFQRAVLKAMATIPYARTATYGDLARQAGDAKASRAVGALCGSNPLPLIIPCHRVVGADGLGGFGGGIEMKKWLLHLELTGRPPLPMGSPDSRADIDEVVAGKQQSLF